MSLTLERRAVHEPSTGNDDRGYDPRRRRLAPLWIYATAVLVGLLLLDVLGGSAYALALSVLTLAALFLARRVTLVKVFVASAPSSRRRVDRQDLTILAAIYVGVVTLFRLAFSVFEGNTAALFLSFAAGLILGVVGPIVYTVWLRDRRLATLGLSLSNLPRTAVLALVFAGVQFSLTLWGYNLPAAKDWVPLLGMALMVGIFEAIFFRGFVQGRIQASFGSGPAVFGAALLYSLYHVGYGMEAEEMFFLFGLGLVYALAYLTTMNLLVLWPLLTPIGSFFAQLEVGELEGELPWASLAGFADVIAVFALAIWFAHRHERSRSLAL